MVSTLGSKSIILSGSSQKVKGKARSIARIL